MGDKPQETTTVNFCDLSESDKALVCAARQADIRVFVAEKTGARAPHTGTDPDTSVALDALRADRDAKVALALRTGLTLDQIDGRRSPEC